MRTSAKIAVLALSGALALTGCSNEARNSGGDEQEPETQKTAQESEAPPVVLEVPETPSETQQETPEIVEEIPVVSESPAVGALETEEPEVSNVEKPETPTLGETDRVFTEGSLGPVVREGEASGTVLEKKTLTSDGYNFYQLVISVQGNSSVLLTPYIVGLNAYEATPLGTSVKVNYSVHEDGSVSLKSVSVVE